MFYISQVNEEICRNGINTQVQQWISSVVQTNPVLAEQMKADVDELAKRWLPADNAGANLTKGYRRNIRYVFGYNGNNEIAIYAKFRILDADVHLDWVVAKPGLPRINCGLGVEPLKSMLAFIAVVGQTLNKPIVLLADNPPLVDKYAARGFVLTGRIESSKPEMMLSVDNLALASTNAPAQTKGLHWEFGGHGTLEEYLADGSR